MLQSIPTRGCALLGRAPFTQTAFLGRHFQHFWRLKSNLPRELHLGMGQSEKYYEEKLVYLTTSSKDSPE